MTFKIFAIVVTYNRRRLLQRCLDALLVQTQGPDCILVIDNASTDGTSQWLDGLEKYHRNNIVVLHLPENMGGAGGFAFGTRSALEYGADWIWLMDDDAEPHPTALRELMRVATNPCNVYGSVATSGGATSWSTTLLDSPIRTVNVASEIPEQAEVESLPFLGFLIHRNLVERIGLPDADYFIAADDIEYCLRASRTGAKLIIVGKSHIEHPQTQRQVIRLLGHNVLHLQLAPWKRYYDTRNRLLIARKYYGIRLLTQTIPGSFVRLFAALRYEPRKLGQAWAFCTGMFDGLLGIKGRRHAKWGIRQ